MEGVDGVAGVEVRDGVSDSLEESSEWKGDEFERIGKPALLNVSICSGTSSF